MEFNVASLLSGVFVGGAVTSLIWVIANVAIKGQQAKKVLDRNTQINSIGEILVEIDALITTHHTGTSTPEQFKRSLTDKMNSVNKLYKPNLHLFDVYYTKFIDALLNHYAEYLRGRIAPLHYENKDEFEESHQKASIFVTPVIDQAPVEKSEIALLPEQPAIIPLVIDKIEESFEPEKLSVEKVSAEKPVLDSTDIESESLEIESESMEFNSLASEVSPEKTKHFKVIPVDDADIPGFQSNDASASMNQDDLAHEAQEIASASIPEDQAADISFEEMAKDVLSEEGKSGEKDFGITPLPQKPPQMSSMGHSKRVQDERDDEGFTMETIMDLDMSKIPAFTSGTSKISIKKSAQMSPISETPKVKVDKISAVEPEVIPVKTNVPQPPVVASGSVAAPSAVKTPNVFKRPPLNEVRPEQPKSEPGLPAGKSSVPKVSSSVKETPDHTGKENVAITGDDVADQIDSFFGIGK